MGIFSGLMANRLVPEMAQLASRIAAGPAPDPLGLNAMGTPSAGALAAGVDPRRLALIQAMLAGRDRVVSRVADPRRRERLAGRAQGDDGGLAGVSMSEAGHLPPEGMEAPLWAGVRYPITHVPEGLRAPRIPLDSDFINQGAARPQTEQGPWQFDTLEQLEAAFDDMAPREELVEIARRGGVLNERWLGELDNALRRRDGDPEAATPFRNFIPEGPLHGPAIVREPESVREYRRLYRQALRRRESPAPRPDRAGPRRLGQLSESEESGGRGVGTISTGQGDPGGKSYGTWQLNRRMVGEFVRSSDGRAWAEELRGLVPGSSSFDSAWRRIAARDPEAFEDAQYRFLRRENYDRLASRLRRTTDLDLDTMGHSIQDVAWSTSVQHGWDSRLAIFREAVESTDRHYSRNDRRYGEELIRNIYAARIAEAVAQREKARRQRRAGEVRTFDNIARVRYPRELANALAAYREEAGQ